MSTNKRVRLQRLVRVTQIIYRREAAELARRQLEAREAGETMTEAERRLDAPLSAGDFLSQLSIVRAANARQKLAHAATQVEAQLDTTLDAMSKNKGAEAELDTQSKEMRKHIADRDGDELLERIGRPGKASLG